MSKLIKMVKKNFRNMRHDIIEFIFTNILRAQWVVNDEDELGFRILGVSMYYYKYDEPLFFTERKEFRRIHKREFGESIKSRYGFDA